MKEQESPLDGTQKYWTQPVYVKNAQGLISRMDDKRSNVFTAHQGKFGSQWLNVVPCYNLCLKLDDQHLRISIGLRLGANICVAHTYHCFKKVERDGSHGLSCTKSVSRLLRHAILNSLINRRWDLSTCLQCSNRVDCTGQGHFVTSHLGDNMASVLWPTKVSIKWVDQIDQSTDIFEEVSIFVVWLGHFAPFAK